MKLLTGDLYLYDCKEQRMYRIDGPSEGAWECVKAPHNLRFLLVTLFTFSALVLGGISLGTSYWHEVTYTLVNGTLNKAPTTINLGIWQQCAAGSDCIDSDFTKDSVCRADPARTRSGKDLTSRMTSVKVMLLAGTGLGLVGTVTSAFCVSYTSLWLWWFTFIANILASFTYAASVVVWVNTWNEWINCGNDFCTGSIFASCKFTYGYSFILACSAAGTHLFNILFVLFCNRNVHAPSKQNAYAEDARAMAMDPPRSVPAEVPLPIGPPSQTVDPRASVRRALSPNPASPLPPKQSQVGVDMTSIVATKASVQRASVPPPPDYPMTTSSVLPSSATLTTLTDDEWRLDPASGMYWSAKQALFLDPESGQYFDPASEHWYNPETCTWAPAV